MRWGKLNAEQIYVEILKRFPEIDYDHQNGGTMYDFFGKEWDLLNSDEKNQAEEWFVQGILKEEIKGIRFGLEPNRETEGRHKVRDRNGNIMYWRIRNDVYKRD